MPKIHKNHVEEDTASSKAVRYIKNQRALNNEDFKDKQLIDKLTQDYKSHLKELENEEKDRPKT